MLPPPDHHVYASHYGSTTWGGDRHVIEPQGYWTAERLDFADRSRLGTGSSGELAHLLGDLGDGCLRGCLVMIVRGQKAEWLIYLRRHQEAEQPGLECQSGSTQA